MATNSLMYPAPLKTHFDVVMDSETFLETLRRFHSSMGTKFMIPVLGGEELDLYHLYFLVTERQGIKKTILDGKWKIVVSSLRIPQNVTNRSFVVKKYYIKLLFHYEQVYLFRRQGPPITPSAVLHPRSNTRHRQLVATLGLNEGDQLPPNEDQGIDVAASGDVPSIEPTLGLHRPYGAQILHTNRGKRSMGENFPTGERVEPNNLFKVTFGSQTMNAILLPFTGPSSLTPPISPVEHPTPCRSAYNIFFDEKYSSMKRLLPHSARDFGKLIDDCWNNLTDDERMVYDDKERADKDRYKREVEYGVYSTQRD